MTWLNCREVIWALYTDGGVCPEFLSRNLFVQFGSFVSRVKLRVLEECSICKMTECLAIVITQKTQVKSELLLLCAGQKWWIGTFLWHMELLGSDNSEFPDVNFCPVPKNNNLDFYFCIWNHAWKWKFWVIIFCTILKTITQNFSKPTKAFNLENIVQACPVSFQTHRVNKDYSNSVKD